MNNPPSNPNTPHVSETTIARFIAIQEKELELKAQELELRKQNDSNTFEFSKHSLDANERYFQNQREHEKFVTICRYIFAGIVILAFLMFMGIGLYLNKDALVMELTKLILYVALGGFGGYNLKAIKQHPKEPQNK